MKVIFEPDALKRLTANIKDPRNTVTDLWCVQYWLTSVASKSPHTRRAYRMQVARWLAWLAATLGPDDNLLRAARYEHADQFLSWIESPDGLPLPPWVAQRYKVRPDKPAATQTVLRQAAVILHGLYDELSAAMTGDPPTSVIQVNPFKPFRRRYSRTEAPDDIDASGVSKSLSDAAWSALWAQAIRNAASPGAKRTAARRRLVLAMLRATWERRNAVAGITWADLRRSRDGRWKVRMQRKGKGKTWALVPDALMDEIAHFRQATALPPMPTPDEARRSVFWAGGRGAGSNGPISDDTLYRDVLALFRLAAASADQTGDPAVATELRRAGAGPHTIRHTMATMYLASGGQARRAQEILGHSSVAVTSRIYDNKSEDEISETLNQQWANTANAKRK